MRSVLVVDDDRLTRWSLGRILTRAGYCVREAGSVAEGVARMGEAWPDLVFLDLHLPDGDGGVVLRVLHELQPRLPVIIMSAGVTREARRQLCAYGADAYIEKPGTPALVLALAETLLWREAPPSDARRHGIGCRPDDGRRGASLPEQTCEEGMRDL